MTVLAEKRRIARSPIVTGEASEQAGKPRAAWFVLHALTAQPAPPQ